MLQVRWIRRLAIRSILRRTREGNHARVRRPRDSRDVETIILVEDSELMHGRVRYARPQIAMTARVLHPRKLLSGRRGRELGGIRRAEHLLQGEGLLCAEGPGSAEKQRKSTCST